MPRPAMFVAIVTAPVRPAWATISASRAACSGKALSSSCLMPRRLSMLLNLIDLSTSVVPIKIGRPVSLHLDHFFDHRIPFLLFRAEDRRRRELMRISGLFVGMAMTSSL